MVVGRFLLVSNSAAIDLGLYLDRLLELNALFGYWTLGEDNQCTASRTLLIHFLELKVY